MAPVGIPLAGQPRRRFSTRSLPLPALTDGDGAKPSPRESAPEVASQRHLYRSALPAIYQDGDFGLRLLRGLEEVLDPIVALLDSLPAHADPDLAPQDVLELLAGWLGVELDESWPDERRREFIRQGPEFARRRGTTVGLELALGIAFPDVLLRVEDRGGSSGRPTRTIFPRRSPRSSSSTATRSWGKRSWLRWRE